MIQTPSSQVGEKHQFRQTGMIRFILTYLGLILSWASSFKLLYLVLVAIMLHCSTYPTNRTTGKSETLRSGFPCHQSYKPMLFHTWSTDHRHLRILQRNEKTFISYKANTKVLEGKPGEGRSQLCRQQGASPCSRSGGDKTMGQQPRTRHLWEGKVAGGGRGRVLYLQPPGLLWK